MTVRHLSSRSPRRWVDTQGVSGSFQGQVVVLVWDLVLGSEKAGRGQLGWSITWAPVFMTSALTWAPVEPPQNHHAVQQMFKLASFRQSSLSSPPLYDVALVDGGQHSKGTTRCA